MTRGKKICNQLKAVRRAVAEANDIPLEIKECTHHGECRGTCPRCEAEVRYLENALNQRSKLGKAAVVAGVAMSLSLTSCHSNSKPDTNDSDDYLYEGEPVEDTSRQANNTDTSQQPTDVVITGWEGEDFGWDDITPGGVEIIDQELGINYVDIEDYDNGPLYPGGEEALAAYFREHINYPQLAIENNIEGKVILQFVIGADGETEMVVVLRDIGGSCGNEAKRVALSLPGRWQPATKEGKPVQANFNYIVAFKLWEYSIPTEGMTE